MDTVNLSKRLQPFGVFGRNDKNMIYFFSYNADGDATEPKL